MPLKAMIYDSNQSIFVNVDARQPHKWRVLTDKRFNFLTATTIPVGPSLYSFTVGINEVIVTRYENLAFPDEMEVTNLPSLAHDKALCGFSLARVYGNQILFTGGRGFQQPISSKAFTLDVYNQIWTEQPSMRVPRRAHSSCALRETGYIYGGYD